MIDQQTPRAKSSVAATTPLQKRKTNKNNKRVHVVWVKRTEMSIPQETSTNSSGWPTKTTTTEKEKMRRVSKPIPHPKPRKPLPRKPRTPSRLGPLVLGPARLGIHRKGSWRWIRETELTSESSARSFPWVLWKPHKLFIAHKKSKGACRVYTRGKC